MLVNDVKKGMRVQLRNGWQAEILDNKKGNIRTAKVFGDYTEIGSVYVKDIQLVTVQGPTGAPRWERVELSPAQQKAAKAIAGWGF